MKASRQHHLVTALKSMTLGYSSEIRGIISFISSAVGDGYKIAFLGSEEWDCIRNLISVPSCLRAIII